MISPELANQSQSTGMLPCQPHAGFRAVACDSVSLGIQVGYRSYRLGPITLNNSEMRPTLMELGYMYIYI